LCHVYCASGGHDELLSVHEQLQAQVWLLWKLWYQIFSTRSGPCAHHHHRLDKYIERAHTNPDGLLGQDDVDDLCHELGQPDLHHPLR
jgi:hypothetical protein